MSNSKKEDFITKLEELAQFMKMMGENEFKIRAFEKGALAIRASHLSLTDIANGKEKVPGIGEGIKTNIKAFLELGDIPERQALQSKIPAGVFKLMQIPGVGAKKALILNQDLGIQSIGELEYACRENRLTTLKGFGDKLQDKILKSIENYKSNKGKLRLDEALSWAQEVEKNIKKELSKSVKIIQVGELARRTEVVELLEFLVNSESKSLKFFSSEKHQTGTMKLGKNELTWISGLYEGRVSVKIYFSEQSLTDVELMSLFADKSVEDTKLSKLQMWSPYWLEKEWIGTSRKPPKNTYRREFHGPVRGIFHCHTDASDGSATLREMVTTAEKLGYEYIGISDHSQSAFYAQGLKVDRIKEQKIQINELQKKVSIKIFHGIESDILGDGNLDYESEVLSQFDFIVASIHSRFQMNRDEMTSRIVRSLENPFTTIWGHPTGRLLLGRKGYELDWFKVFSTAQKHGVSVEINANPQRLDLDWRLGSEIEKHGLSVCINPDAHSVDGLSDTIYGEWMTEKAMIPENLILNRKTVNEIESYLSGRKKRALR